MMDALRHVDQSVHRCLGRRDRASYDFGCPKGQVETVPIGTLTIEARGCGKKSLYVSNGHTYVRNAEISPDK
jgi:hypothetical protein